MAFSAKYNQDGSVSAGPMSDGTSWGSIPKESRYWPELMALTNNGKDIESYSETVDDNYRIGKSTPWRRMTDSEAAKVADAMKQQTIKNQMIYDAASYIDTSDELFGTLKALLTSLFSAARADELLAREE